MNDHNQSATQPQQGSTSNAPNEDDNRFSLASSGSGGVAVSVGIPGAPQAQPNQPPPLQFTGPSSSVNPVPNSNGNSSVKDAAAVAAVNPSGSDRQQNVNGLAPAQNPSFAPGITHRVAGIPSQRTMLPQEPAAPSNLQPQPILQQHQQQQHPHSFNSSVAPPAASWFVPNPLDAQGPPTSNALHISQQQQAQTRPRRQAAHTQLQQLMD